MLPFENKGFSGQAKSTEDQGKRCILPEQRETVKVLVNKSLLREEHISAMNLDIFSVGSLVSVTSYRPYFGCTGIILSVDVITDKTQDPLPFSLLSLRESQGKKPMCFEHDAVSEVAGTLIPSSRLPGKQGNHLSMTLNRAATSEKVR